MNLELYPSCASSSSTSQPPQLQIATGRRTWKNLKGKNEAVWPPNIEATLIEALEKYRPGASASTKLLGRFPKRNRFISDYIFKVTGKRRNPKQVGSRIQQLRDTCDDPHIQQLLSRTRYLRSGGSDTSSDAQRSPNASEYSQSQPTSPTDYRTTEGSPLGPVSPSDPWANRYSPPSVSPTLRAPSDSDLYLSAAPEFNQPELTLPRTYFDYTTHRYPSTPTTTTNNRPTHMQPAGYWPISSDGVAESYSSPPTIYQTSPTPTSTNPVPPAHRVVNTFNCVSTSCSTPPLHSQPLHDEFSSFQRATNPVFLSDYDNLPLDHLHRYPPTVASFTSLGELDHRAHRNLNNTEAGLDCFTPQGDPRVWRSTMTNHIDPLMGEATAWGPDTAIQVPSRSSLSSALLPTSPPLLQPIADQTCYPLDPRQVQATYPAY